MPEITITVRGSFDAFHPPERATANLLVAHQGPNKAAVYGETTSSASRVTTILGGITHPEQGPVTWWASDRLRTWPEKPWNQEGKQLPLVHHAAVGVEAKFRDFEALGRFLDEVTVLPGVAVNGLTWTLTEVRKQEVTRQARQEAVRDATERATDYASALGLTSVTAIAVADVGMLGDQVNYSAGSGGPVAFARAAAVPSGGQSPLDLSPNDVAVSASVDVRFTAM